MNEKQKQIIMDYVPRLVAVKLIKLLEAESDTVITQVFDQRYTNGGHISFKPNSTIEYSPPLSRRNNRGVC
jgi:hypothetical protein